MQDNAELKSDDTPPVIGVVFSYDDEGELIIPYLPIGDPEPEVEKTPLTPDEKDTLQECETEIEANLNGFTIVGSRLYNIWSQKLYRETHRTFEAYCKEKWGISRFHASRLIKASQVVANLEKEHQVGNISIPLTEAAAREIADLDAADQVKVAQKVKESVGNRKANAQDFKRARKEVAGPKATKTRKPNAAKVTKGEAAEQPDNVIAIPSAQPEKGMALVPLPLHYHQELRDLPSLKELSKMAIDLDNMRSNKARNEEQAKLIGQLRRWLSLYAEWEQHCLIPAGNKLKEAA